MKIVTYSIIMLFMASAHAQEYYKWVDAEGVTHYGEVRPNPEVNYEKLDFPSQYATSNPSEDYYSIQNQLKRVQEQRLLWRESNLLLNRPQPEVVVQEVVYQPEEVRYVPVYPYRYKRHHYKHNHHHKKHYKDGAKPRYKDYAGKSYKRSSNMKMPKRNPALIVKTH